MGILLQKISSFRLLARRLLISEISASQFASFSTKNAHYHDYRSHLTGFCSFDCNLSAFVVSLRAVLADKDTRKSGLLLGYLGLRTLS